MSRDTYSSLAVVSLDAENLTSQTKEKQEVENEVGMREEEEEDEWCTSKEQR